MREKILNKIKEMLAELGLPSVAVKLDFPEDFAHGAYTTNVAMALGKQVGEKPVDLAEKIAGKLRSNLPAGVGEVKVALPGFINFFLTSEFLASVVSEVNQAGKNYGLNNSRVGQKIIIEYTDPNPFKEFHIGHLMSNTIGEAFSRLVETSGAEVKRACYQGDVGMHVAKTIWFLRSQKLKDESEKWGVEELGSAYVTGSKAYEENDVAKKEIIEINKKVYDRSDEEINKLYDWGRKVSLEYFETIYQKLGTKFDFYFFESETGKFGGQLVKENLGKVFEKGENDAVIFPGEKYSLHTRVFINSEGLPTYEAKELGLAKIKYDKYPYYLSVVVTGNEINEYFKVLLKALSLIYPDLAVKTKHQSHGMLRLPSGKMSSRSGNVITAEMLIEEAKTMARGNEQVAIGAIKYAILRQAPGKNIIFDMAQALSLEGDSGPYLQYALVRAQAVLSKARENFLHDLPFDGPVPSPAKFVDGALEQLLLQYPEVVARAEKELAPQHLTTYLTALASEFNAFYAKEKILDAGPASIYRIPLTQAVAQVLHNGLTLLAIPIPEKM